MERDPRCPLPPVSQLLRQQGQEHLVEHLATLEPAARTRLEARLRCIDWEELSRPATPPPLEQLEPPRVITLAERLERGAAWSRLGEEAYRRGQVAVLLVAGGQGTRLGRREPKGCFPIMPHSGKSLYQLQAEKVVSLSRRLGHPVPLLLMTSPATDEPTRAFFAAARGFGLTPDQLRIFCQGTVPSTDAAGRLLLAGPGELLENPDGHGGCFTALVASGNLSRLRQEGIRYLVYIQVDNVLAPVDDPLLVGLCAAEGAEVITKVLPKAHPDERVGHLLRVGGRDHIVEYTELSSEDVRRRGPDGELIYRWGSPALHCFSTAFLARLAEAGFRLPLHRSRKPLQAYVDGQVRQVVGYKSERFIFDLLPQAQVSLGLEVRREEEFAPVKNAVGDDSPETAVRLASALYARWLEAVGVRVALPPGALIELSPLLAATESQLRQRWDGRVREITAGCLLE